MIKHSTAITTLNFSSITILFVFAFQVCIFQTKISKTSLPYLMAVATTLSSKNWCQTFSLCLIQQGVRAVSKLSWFWKSSTENVGKKSKKVFKYMYFFGSQIAVSTLIVCHTSVPALFSHIIGLSVLSQGCDSWIYNATLDIRLAHGMLSFSL